jgi:predicted DNA-binding protein (MmcQ/YjbR family)
MRIDIDSIREFCLTFPGSTEQVQWEESLLFKVGGKIFVIYNMGSLTPNRISLKCSPESFEELIENEFVIPAPYLARNKWITLQDGCRLKPAEIKELITNSYSLVFSKLTKKLQNEIIK